MDNQISLKETAKFANDKAQDGADMTIASINWSNTSLYVLHESKKSQVLLSSQDNYSEEEIDQILEKFRTDANSYRTKEEAEPFYVKSQSTLKVLMMEQSVDAARFQKIQDMYKEVSLETTMKLLIRCRMAFDTRRTVLELFDIIDTYQSQYEELRDIILKAAGDNDALTVQEIYCEQGKLNEIKNVSKVIKSSAQCVLKKADELRKREEKGEKGSYTVLFKNEDLIERILGEVKHIKFLLDKCKKIQINNDLEAIQTNADPNSVDQERSPKVKFEEDESASVRRGSTKSQRKGSNPKKKKRSNITPSGRGSNMSNKSNRSNKSPGQPYQQLHNNTEPQNQYMTIPENENFDLYQQRMMKQHHQMFKTAHEGGFYKGPETDRSMSKKKRKQKGKKVRNNSQYNFQKTQQQTTLHTPISGSTGPSNFTPTPGSSMKPPSMYGIKNVTMMKNPLQFANTGQNFYNHDKLTDTSMNMSNAMKRKINLPNAMPRRQDVMYDLNGRPIFKAIHGTADNANSSKSRSPRPNDTDFISYAGSSRFIESKTRNQLPIQIQQTKKGSPLNIRTEYSQPIFKNRKGSHQVPKQSNYNITRNPEKIMHTQLSTISKQNIKREASSSPPQKQQILPDIKPSSRGIDQIQKLKRPEAASEKAHIFNPRARSVNRQKIPKSGENSGMMGLMPGSSGPGGSHIQINKMGINKNSQPDMDLNEGNNTQRDEFKANNMNRKLSPLDNKLNTDRGGMNSSQTPFGFKKNSMAETSFGNIKGGNEDQSNMDLSMVSQKQHKWPSPGRSSNMGQNKKSGAVGSLYSGNQAVDQFTSQYSSVWLKGNQGMYNDNAIGSDVQRQKREANSMLFQMERQQKKMEQMQVRAAKDALCQHYLENYGILPTSQQRFFLDPIRLRELLIKMATQVTQRAAATKIQHWYRGRLRRLAFLKMLRDTIRATKRLQKFFRMYRFTVILPRKLKKRQQEKSFFIQQCLRGYQARRIMLKAKANMQIDKEYEYWHRINLIQKGNFQRRVRRVWLAFKERKAEKERKKKEAEAAKKAKKPVRRRAPAAAAPAPVAAKPAAAAKTTAAPAQDLSATQKIPATKPLSTADTANLNQTITSTNVPLTKTDSQCEIFDNDNATKENDDVQMIDGEVVNITVSQGNDGTNQEDKTGEGLDVINEEDQGNGESKPDPVEGEENPEGQENPDGGEQPENEDGMDGEMNREEAD